VSSLALFLSILFSLLLRCCPCYHHCCHHYGTITTTPLTTIIVVVATNAAAVVSVAVLLSSPSPPLLSSMVIIHVIGLSPLPFTFVYHHVVDRITSLVTPFCCFRCSPEVLSPHHHLHRHPFRSLPSDTCVFSPSSYFGSPRHRTRIAIVSFPCYSVQHGEATAVATAMDLPSSNYPSTMTTLPPRWTLATCTSKFLPHTFLFHYYALPLSPRFSGNSHRQRRTCHNGHFGPSPRATWQWHPRCTLDLPQCGPRSLWNGASRLASATSWARRRSNSRERRMAICARLCCGWRLSCGRTS